MQKKYGTYSKNNTNMSLADKFSDAIYSCLTPEQIYKCYEHCFITVTDEEKLLYV